MKFNSPNSEPSEPSEPSQVSHTKDDKDGGGVVFKSSTGAYRNPSSFAFLPLTSSDNGAAYPDGTHKLKCYEVR